MKFKALFFYYKLANTDYIMSSVHSLLQQRAIGPILMKTLHHASILYHMH